MENKSSLIFGIVFFILFLAWGGTRIVQNIMFDRNCEGHLKRAADANTIHLAKQELTEAVKYMEEAGLTNGYTSIIYNTPDEDLKFWYENIKSALNELEAISPEATQLEKSNMLMKLRETLLDQEGGETSITTPTGISIFPNNTSYMLWALVSTILCLVFFISFGRSNYLFE